MHFFLGNGQQSDQRQTTCRDLSGWLCITLVTTEQNRAVKAIGIKEERLQTARARTTNVALEDSTLEKQRKDYTYITHAVRCIFIALSPLKMAWGDSGSHCG